MMSAHSHHPFFQNAQIEELTLGNFDERLKASQNELVGVFFWGHDCPNCEVAKTQLNLHADDFNALGLKWYHVNTYENFELGTRFGLFGIPTFLFFYQGQRLGKISPFPGTEPFFAALTELKDKYL